MKKRKKRLFEIGIRGQLMLIFVSIILVAGTVIGYTAYMAAREQAHDQIRNNLEKRAEDWAEVIGSFADEVNNIRELEDSMMRRMLNETSLSILELMRASDEDHHNGNVTDARSMEFMYDSFSKMHIGEDGYVFIIVADGPDRGKYLLSKDHSRDGENIYLERDADGEFIIRDMIDRAVETPEEPFIVEYTWKNPGDDDFRQKIASLVYYQPWNVIIGASAYPDDYRSDMEDNIKERAKKMIADQVIGKTGYIWVLRGTGNDRGTYIVSGGRERDGENLWDIRDDNGDYFVREIVEIGMETPDDAAFYSYDWKNPGESGARKKIAAITYVPEWDWVIGASAYESEFLEDVIIMRNRIIIFTLLELVVAIAAIYMIGTKFSRTITNPLKRLTRKAEELGSGNVDPKEIETSVVGGSKELRALARTIEDARIARLQSMEANERLERSEARLKELTSMLPEILFETAPDTTFTFCNRVAMRKLAYRGLSCDDGLKLKDIIVKKDKKRFYKKLKELIRGREPVPEEFTIIRRNGTTFPGLLNMNLILKNGMPVGFRGIIIDITDRKRSESKIREEKNKAEFYLDMLGHDIGNLHMGISSSIEFAGMLKDDPEAQERALNIAKNVSKRSMKLTDSVMLLSRIRSERPLLERLDVKKIIEEGVELARDTYPDKNIRVQINGSSKRINAEPILREAFYNIISNGIKVQKDEEDPWIEVNIRDSDNGESISIEICDKGYGIPDKSKKKVFERFWTSGKGSRIGLGLSIVRALVERYNGNLRIEDRIKGDHSKGTKFILEFPRA